MGKLVDELFQAARQEVLRLVLQERVTTSMRDLAARCGLSTEAVRKEVLHLERAGLLTTQAKGAAKLVAANWANPACQHLLALFDLDAAPRPEVTDTAVRESLQAYGAPLLEDHPQAHWSLEETLVFAAELARRDATVLRVLPVVLATHHRTLDRKALRRLAVQHRVKAEVGVLLDLTGNLIGEKTLQSMAKPLFDEKQTEWRDFPQTRNEFEAELAVMRSPEVARRWRFRMNMSEDSFRSFLSKHCPGLVHA